MQLEHSRTYKVSISLKENATPVFRKAYNIPYSLQDMIHEKLKKLRNQGIIAPINYSTWVTPIVVVQKKRKKKKRNKNLC